MAVSFKDSTDGSLSTAINAMKAALMGRSFIGINQQGQINLLYCEILMDTLFCVETKARTTNQICGTM